MTLRSPELFFCYERENVLVTTMKVMLISCCSCTAARPLPAVPPLTRRSTMPDTRTSRSQSPSSSRHSSPGPSGATASTEYFEAGASSMAKSDCVPAAGTCKLEYVHLSLDSYAPHLCCGGCYNDYDQKDPGTLFWLLFIQPQDKKIMVQYSSPWVLACPWAKITYPWAIITYPWAIITYPWAIITYPWAIITYPWAMITYPWAMITYSWALPPQATSFLMFLYCSMFRIRHMHTILESLSVAQARVLFVHATCRHSVGNLPFPRIVWSICL